MSKYQNLSKEELLRLVEKQEAELASKKYGLVWDSEREPEQVVLDCENNLPVLKRVKGKEIRTVNKDDNILIEGDNYHALTVLNYTHKEKIDVIYIDPPYNTGNKDFIYNDKYIDKEDGFRHSKWLNFMEKRLKLAKDLLKETGVIFISIDDNEQAQLKLLCDNIFGETNFIADFVWNSTKSITNPALVSVSHTYNFAYAKDKSIFDLKYRKNFKLPAILEGFSNSDNDPRGSWKADPFEAGGIRKNQMYPIKNPKTGEIFYPNKGNCWKNDLKKYKELIKDNRIVFGKDGRGRPQRKRFIWEAEERGLTPNTWWDDVGTTTNGTMELKNIFGDKIFNNPKPVSLVKRFLLLGSKQDSVILDFMAGSGTTGHAVLDLNKEDGGNRKFILCTNNELNGLEKELREKGMSEKEIAEHGICRRVTYPRLEKVIKGYRNLKGEKIEGLGGNLQYFRTDFVRKNKNRDQVRIGLTGKCTEMLCVKENIFNLEKENENYKIFSSNKKDKILCVYYNFMEYGIPEFIDEIKKIKARKIIFMFSIDNEVDKKIFSGVKNFTVKAIPEEILEEYRRLNKLNIPANKDLIYFDFNKANKIIFKQKNKDDGARHLRIVLEKLIQKVAQINGMNILKISGKDEKTAWLNDKLKKDNIFSKVEWEENKTFLTIGNQAAHGEYDEYNLDQVENFYRHIQTLLNKFNI